MGNGSKEKGGEGTMARGSAPRGCQSCLPPAALAVDEFKALGVASSTAEGGRSEQFRRLIIGKWNGNSAHGAGGRSRELDNATDWPLNA